MKRALIFAAIVCCALFTACDDESSQIETDGEQESERTTASDGPSSTDNLDHTTTDDETPTERETSSDTDRRDSEKNDGETDTDTGMTEGENTDRDTHTNDPVDTEAEADSATIEDVDTDAATDTSGSSSEPPCYGVSRDGCCRGNIVYWCWTDGQNDHLGEEDCGGYDCGWSDKIGMFKCKLGGGDPVPQGMTADCPPALP